jgi:hypothetical protein
VFCSSPKLAGHPSDPKFQPTDFFRAIAPIHPVVNPFHPSPTYSNIGYSLLAYALEIMTSTPFADLLQSTILDPLDMNSTFYTRPPMTLDTKAVIPAGEQTWYTTSIASYGPVGAIYSTITDLRKFGKSILSNTLLSRPASGRWMRPRSFTSDANVTVGAAWEITRTPTQRTGFIYAKSGGLGVYEAELALLPDFDAGFNVVAAGGEAAANAVTLSNIAAVVFAPALEQAAKQEARDNYAGTYSYLSETMNGTAVVTVDDDELYPGLKVSSFDVDGDSLTSIIAGLAGLDLSDDGDERLSLRLYPSGLTSTTNLAGETGTGTTSMGWRLIYQPMPNPNAIGSFKQDCTTWAYIDSVMYGVIGLDEFAFSLDGTGRVVGLEAKVLDAGTGNVVFKRQT